MNLIDAYVTQVLSDPYERYGKWWVEVAYTSEGWLGKTSLMFDTKRECLAVFPGHKFAT